MESHTFFNRLSSIPESERKRDIQVFYVIIKKITRMIEELAPEAEKNHQERQLMGLKQLTRTEEELQCLVRIREDMVKNCKEIKGSIRQE